MMRSAALQSPVRSTFPRVAGSARRTTHVDMVPAGDGLILSGAARDLVTTAAGDPITGSSAAIDSRLDRSATLRSIRVDPDEPAVQSLVGVPVAGGFRAEVEATVPDRGSPLRQLLDDLPVAAMLSGYAHIYSEPPNEQLAAVAARRADVCAGWAGEGTMMRAIRSTGLLPVPVGPVAPDPEPPDDPWAWHALPALRPGSMRRRRAVDVAAGPELIVRATFRDSHTSDDGTERILHEYTLEAAVDSFSGVFTRCTATPAVLPWPECPSAAAGTAELVGAPVGAVDAVVRRELKGLRGCTHLNDLLRSLSAVVPLARLLGLELDHRGGEP
ncbi:MAG TPA: DUF2889 domain-containing protein [Acidimicrobiales bacterium]|nr:DUF2889 domain-containing protein [Acidimicrobiales bacterium]